MPKVLLESKGLKQYFPTGKKRNEKKNLKRLSLQAVELFKKNNPDAASNSKPKDLFNDIHKQFEGGKKFNTELDHVLTEYVALSKVHGERLYVKANDGINISIYEGETVGLVGESGCGKSTFGSLITQKLRWYHLDKKCKLFSRIHTLR
jgi:peptide/nickel transport system ATP-binding protein/oligopeptide transport system ATP-binding protein